MRRLAYLAIALSSVIAVLAAFAQGGGGRLYDWRSANQYRWHENLDGSTAVYGSNLRTGARWQTTIEPMVTCAAPTAEATPGDTLRVASRTVPRPMATGTPGGATKSSQPKA